MSQTLLSKENEKLESENIKSNPSIENFQKILKKDPENYSAFIGLGQCYLEMQMWEESLYNFLRAEVIKPSIEVYLNIGILFYKKENYKKAIEYYQKAENFGKPIFEGIWNKGLAYEKIKERQKAVQAFDKAYQLKPRFELCFKIAPLALQAKEYQTAIKYYNIILEKEENPLYYAELGLAFMELKEYEKSKKCYQKAKELSKLASKYSQLDEITYEDFVAKYPNIENQIQKIQGKIQKGKAGHNDHVDLGNMFFIQGDYKKSLTAYKKARDLFVSNLLVNRL